MTDIKQFRPHQRIPEDAGESNFESTTSTGDAGSNFVEVFDRSGLHDALGYLNGRVRFRFTGIYRFEPSVLVNLYLYDRENPTLHQSGAILPLPSTYCEIVRALGDVFATENAPADSRLEGHAARNTVISYTGVPIRMAGGLIAGVLCHHDLRPRLLPREELGTMRSAAHHLASWLGPSLTLLPRDKAQESGSQPDETR